MEERETTRAHSCTYLRGSVAYLHIDLGRRALDLLAAGGGADLVLAGDRHLEAHHDLLTLLGNLRRDNLLIGGKAMSLILQCQRSPKLKLYLGTIDGDLHVSSGHSAAVL